MKKTRLFALLVALLMLGTTAFAQTAEDPVVVRVGDVTIGLAEAQEIYDYYYAQYESLYAQNYMVFSQEDKELLRDEVVKMLEYQALEQGKAAELGLDEISEEDREALRAEAETTFESDLAEYAVAMGMEVDAAREAVAELGFTPESYYEQAVELLPYTRLYEDLVKDIEVSDEDVQAEYQSYVDRDRESYETDIESYEMYTAYYGNADIYYIPDGYRLVKHILLETPEDVSAELMDLQADITDAKTELDAFIEELYALENVDEEAEVQPREEAEIQKDIDAAQAAYDELNRQYEEKEASILPSLAPIIDEINEKLVGGATFDEMIAEYNTDPGMASTPDGYQVHKESIMWEPTFRDAAMALENIGDISEPVLTEFGVHIIQYAGDVQGGPVVMTEEQEEALRETLLTSLQDAEYQKLFAVWMEEAEVQSHPELIVVPSDAAEDAGAEGGDTEEAVE